MPTESFVIGFQTSKKENEKFYLNLFGNLLRGVFLIVFFFM